MARSAAITSVLLDTEVPELVLARDEVDTQYLCLLVDADSEVARYLAVPVSAARVGDLRAGRVDLRAALDEPEIQQWYAGVLTGNAGLQLQLTEISEVPQEWFPSTDFSLSSFIEDVGPGDELVNEALRVNGAVVACTLDAQGNAVGTIDADRLSTGLGLFQAVLRHGLKRALADSPSWRLTSASVSPTLQVYAFSEGSFRIHMRTTGRADLTGVSAMGLALAKLDELFAAAATPEASLDVVQRYRGHFVAAYRSLLRFISHERTALGYRWADPAMGSVRASRVAPDVAERMYEFLTARQELGIEDVVLSGRFLRIDSKRGSWTLAGDDGHEYKGQVAEGLGEILRGLTIATQAYRLNCIEALEETRESGRQRARLFLQKVYLL